MIAVQTFEQDTNVYEFPDECVVMPDFDKKPFFTKLSGAQAIHAKGCDIIAIPDEVTLYLIEAKDYSHSNPSEKPLKAPKLAWTIASKSFDTLACLMVGATRMSKQRISAAKRLPARESWCVLRSSRHVEWTFRTRPITAI